MTQAGNCYWAGIPKCFWVIIFMTEQLGYASCSLYAHDRGSMGDQSTVSGMSYICSPPRGGQSRGFCSIGIEMRTSRSTVHRLHPPNHGGCDNFSQNVCIYSPEHVKISKESKFEISKIWPSQELNPGHQSHSPVIIPLDHCLILRNIKSENINLIWHHLVSHQRVGKVQTDISH